MCVSFVCPSLSVSLSLSLVPLSLSAVSSWPVLFSERELALFNAEQSCPPTPCTHPLSATPHCPHLSLHRSELGASAHITPTHLLMHKGQTAGPHQQGHTHTHTHTHTISQWSSGGHIGVSFPFMHLSKYKVCAPLRTICVFLSAKK